MRMSNICMKRRNMISNWDVGYRSHDDRKTKNNSVLSSNVTQQILNSSYDSIDSLIISFRNMRDDHENTCERKYPSDYKIISPTSDEKEDTRRNIQNNTEHASAGYNTQERTSAHMRRTFRYLQISI